MAARVIVLVLLMVVMALATTPSWKNEDLETLVSKDRIVLERAYGEWSLLNLLREKEEVTPAVFNREANKVYATLSSFLNVKIQTPQEAKEVFDFFVKTGKAYSAAARTAGVFTMTNVLLIIAVVVIVIASGVVFSIYILPYLLHLTWITKIFLAYSGAIIILMFAKYVCNVASQNFVAVIGAIALAAAYMYHLSFLSHMPKPPWAKILSPIFIAWSFLTVLFRTKLIGFISIATLESMLGFVVWTGPLCTAIGFQDEEAIRPAALASGVLVSLYIALALKVIPLTLALKEAVELFEPGILFCGTFVFYTSILILSSRYGPQRKSVLGYNILAMVVGLSSFFLGSLIPELTLFRGVASTFFVIFLMQKYIEIDWRGAWSLGLLGGGLGLAGICFFVKSFPELFAFT